MWGLDIHLPFTIIDYVTEDDDRDVTAEDREGILLLHSGSVIALFVSAFGCFVQCCKSSS